MIIGMIFDKPAAPETANLSKRWGSAIYAAHQPFHKRHEPDMPGYRNHDSSDRRPAAGAFGPRLSEHFGLSHSDYLALSDEAPRFAVTHLMSGTSMLGRACQLPSESAFFVILHLIPAFLDIRPPGQAAVSYWCSAGSIDIVSLTTAPIILLGSPLDCLGFYIHCSFLDELTAQLGGLNHCTLRCVHGTPDPIINNIGAALMPLLKVPNQVASEFLDHIARATCLHLAQAYGSIRYNGGP